MPIKGILGGAGVKPLGYGLGSAETEETDPNFNKTVLLLHADGSEGAGNTSNLGNPNFKAFRDNSTSAHAIVVNGDAYGNDFSPYYYANGYWSNLFDASGDYFTIPASSDFNFGTGQFTIELFVYFTNSVGSGTLIGQSGFGSVLQLQANGYFQYYDINTASYLLTGAVTASKNTWTHVVVQRDASNNLDLFVNGTRQATTTSTATLGFTNAQNLTIHSWNGNISPNETYYSNIRIIKGSSVYTSGSSITVPTTPLTAVAGTELLTCQSNRFIDNSTTGRTITVSGDPKVSTNTPFTVTKTANVGSGFFDGSGDYLTATHATDFDFSGEFTAECWFYLADAVNWGVLFCVDTGDRFQVAVTNSDTIDLRFNGGAAVGTPFSINKHEWNHVAVTRDSSNVIRQFLNGVLKNTDTDTSSLDNGYMRIGANQLASNPFDGYIADVNIENGNCKYNTGFTPPTSTISADTDTKLLTCQYSGAVRNVGFVDDSKYNHQIIRSGDTTLGTFSPFSLEDGYWSNSISPNSGLTFPNSSAFAFGTGAFTIEFWVFGGADNDQDVILEGRSAVGGSFHITYGGYSSTSNSLRYVPGSGSTITTGSDLIADNTWHHVAIERDGSNNVTLYIDGVSKGTGTDSTNYTTTTGTWAIGYSNTASSNYSNAYYSNFRIVKGSNVYGGAFTPPTTPLTAVSNTQLLTCQSNRFIDNSSNSLTLTLTGTPKVLPFSPFVPTRSYSKDAVGGSMFLDGSGDYIYAEGNSSKPFKVLSNSEFSIEFWYYRLTSGSVDVVISGDVLDEFQLAFDASNKLDVYMFGSRLVSSPTFPLASNPSYTNAWHHFVMTREDHDTKVRTFINGELVSITAANTGDADFDDLVIGHQGKGTNHPTHGYMAGVRFSNSGVPSAYQTTETSTGTQVFTPPTAPVTADTSTQLLLSFNNAGIIDHTMKNNLETEGNTRISGQQIKFGTGSIYFDGTDDKIVLPHQEYQQLGTDEFTVELFVYFTSTDQRQGFFGNDTGWYFQIYDGELEFALSVSAVIERSFSHSINQWYHLAATRDSSNDIRLFIDGTQQGAVVNSTANLSHASNNFHIGNIGPATSRLFKGGYMDEIRITKGVARYNSNFTVPTKAFANR